MAEDIWIVKGKTVSWFTCSCSCWLICFDNSSSCAQFMQSRLHRIYILVYKHLTFCVDASHRKQWAVYEIEKQLALSTQDTLECATWQFKYLLPHHQNIWPDFGDCCKWSVVSYNLVPSLSPIMNFKEYANGQLPQHPWESTRLQQQGNKFSLRLPFLERQKLKLGYSCL